MLDTTPLLRLYAAWRRRQLARLDPAATQERLLLRLVARAADTRFGQTHEFHRIRSVADFQAQVPLRRYEDFWRDWWQPPFPTLRGATWPDPVPFFALSSGTTSGATKHIPCTAAMLRSNTRAALDLLVHHVTHRPASRVFGGQSFMLGGSTDLTTVAPGIVAGDLSGIARARLPAWARRFGFPPLDIALMSDWETKLDRLAATAPKADIRLLTGTPSWLLILFEQIAAKGLGDTAPEAFPRLELLVHGGVNFAPYRPRFEAWLAGSKAELREAYPASEGFLAVADRGPGEGLRLMIDNGLFFEFVPMDELDRPHPTRHWVATMQPGIDYALVLSSCAGLWAYVLGDTVTVVDRATPRVLITGRTSWAVSFFGEHLIDAEIETAIAAAAEAIGAMVTDFTLGADLPTGGLGGHVFLVEFEHAPAPARISAFAAALDRKLAALNDDYRAHRAEGFGLRAPEVHLVAPGGFARWMKAQGRLGGQNKVPRVIGDPARFEAARRALLA
ncbi:GH3 family domain-containing protein [Desertibaculum subflavum]|uniref:GH3 family domain-containing protein n=1 Tax=Desertibaculum subflavum TaxID=2268458 RepID=UPI000E66ED3D